MKQSAQKEGWNYRVSRFFLENKRLTILSFILVSFLGITTTALMKTTGFPNPSVSFFLIQTVYPGASPETVSTEVTQPIEGVIKDIEDISTYSSYSSSSVSVINVSVEDGASIESVRSQVDSAIASVPFPDTVNDPEIFVPIIADPAMIFSIAGENLEHVYTVSEQIKQDLGELPETARIDALVDLERVLLVKLDTEKMKELGIATSEVQQQLATIGETLPVVSQQEIDGTIQTIQTRVSGETLDDIRQIQFFVSPATPETNTQPQGSAVSATVTQSAPQKYLLDDFAEVTIDYRFTDNATPFIGVRTDQEQLTIPALTLQLRAIQGIELSQYTEVVEEIFASYENAELIPFGEEQRTPTQDTLIVEHFTSAHDNEKQVDEVVSGLIGGPLDINSSWKHLGWFLGGMQLVFLVMIAFVSWRAALVASFAIPLSLVFANIYLYFTGNDLNTLVLFSLVLVIGLVVDPALVILESIQRKIDIGLKGKEAALAAISDVGGGLFLATLTNIIVFMPFGLISGLLGQIFRYIPLTIIPAVIGSYVVPLIFLAWIGGIFLKPKKKSSTNEEENLWAVARWLMRVNTRILHSPVWIRALIVFSALVIPLAVAAITVGAGKVKIVQFASGQNGDTLSVVAKPLRYASPEEQKNIQKEVISSLLENTAVSQVYTPESTGTYRINLQSAKERGGYISTKIADDIRLDLEQKKDILDDLIVRVEGVGPPVQSYEVALAITEKNPDVLRRAAIDVASTVQKVCLLNQQVTITDECSGERIVTKVDDGYTGKETSVLDIAINRNMLNEKHLANTSAGPYSILVNAAIKEQFVLNNNEVVKTISLDGYDTDIILERQKDAPDSQEALEDTSLMGIATVDDVADIQKETSAPTITRVKGETLGVVQARLALDANDQSTASAVTQAVVEYYQENNGARAELLGLQEDDVEQYTEGFTASNNRSFQDLFLTLIVAIFLTYLVLAIFFESFAQPLVILFAIPLTFLGVFPGLSAFAGGQFGFLEIIGLIILVGIVENVAIFLIDAARQKILQEGWEPKKAIAYASGIRLRPVLMTKFTAIASLLPLAYLSETYRSIAVVIMCGLITSGITSLFTTPILFIFFQWMSNHFWPLSARKKILFILFFPIAIVVLAIQKRNV